MRLFTPLEFIFWLLYLKMEFANMSHAAVLILCLYLVDAVIQTEKIQYEHGISRGEQELKEILVMVKEQNRKLVLQNKRIQQVNSSSTPDVNEKQNTSVAFNQTSTLQVLSIKSSGSISNVTKISITYVAPIEHFVYWIGPREDGRTWRKVGDKKTHTARGFGVYTSTVYVEDISSLRSIFFRLNDDEHTISIRLNTTAAGISQQQEVTQPHSSLIEVMKTFTAPQNSDLTITAVIDLNITLLRDYSVAELWLSGLNTSTNPPTYFETYDFSSDAINLNFTQRTNETTNCNITLSHDYIKYGGFLNIRLLYIESSKDRLIDEYSFGPSIKIFAYGTNEVIPYNEVGVLPLENQTLIFSPSQSILCVAFGNPRPNATLLKVGDKGDFITLETETTYFDKYTQTETVSLSANQLKNEGRYICRVTNGIKTVETSTEAVVVTEVKIDESRTGVVLNTSNIIVISCKARGKPRPEVDFRLYDKYGPFMIKSGLFKSMKSTSGKYTSRVTLTLSAVDDIDVHTVYCYAAQADKYRSIERSRRINIFPEGRENNWDLYYRVQAAQAS